MLLALKDSAPQAMIAELLRADMRKLIEAESIAMLEVATQWVRSNPVLVGGNGAEVPERAPGGRNRLPGTLAPPDT